VPLKRPRGSAWWGCSPLPARVDVAAASHITPRSVATCESVRHRRPDRARSRERPSIAVEGNPSACGDLFFYVSAPRARRRADGELDDDDARVFVASR
jgi:hypothetical protein